MWAFANLNIQSNLGRNNETYDNIWSRSRLHSTTPAGNKDAKMDQVQDPISDGGKQQVTGRNRQVMQLHTGRLLVPYIKTTSKNVRVLSEFSLPWFDESAVVALNYHLDF